VAVPKLGRQINEYRAKEME